jgi:hypothetical protein
MVLVVKWKYRLILLEDHKLDVQNAGQLAILSKQRKPIDDFSVCCSKQSVLKSVVREIFPLCCSEIDLITD